MDPSAALAILRGRSAALQSDQSELCAAAAPIDGGAPTAQPSTLPALKDLDNQPTRALLRHLLGLQERRVEQYKAFEGGFETFLSVVDADGYEALVQRVTSVFARISADVNAVEASLRSRGGAEALAATARSIQELEKRKLEATAQMHITRHQLAAAREDGDVSDPRELRLLEMREQERIELRETLESLRERIRDALDDVRCELAEIES